MSLAGCASLVGIRERAIYVPATQTLHNEVIEFDYIKNTLDDIQSAFSCVDVCTHCKVFS